MYGEAQINPQYKSGVFRYKKLANEQIQMIFNNQTNMLSSNETNTRCIWQANVTVNNRTIDSKHVESNYLRIL